VVDFWSDAAAAQKVVQELSRLRERITRYDRLGARREDALVLLELADEVGDREELAGAAREAEALDREVAALEVETLLSGKYDSYSAILTLHAGAGGTESQDWVEMLTRMFTRWAEARAYKVEVLDLLPGEEAGIKSITLGVRGDNAYGYLRSEKGVHRLVRISPFDSSARRHTSFASVDVIPEIESDDEVEVNSDDLRVDTFRASSAGGQHVNKTDSAVRITHLPTGIVVSCQNERSQHMNKATCLRVLRSKLLELKERERLEEMAALRGEQTDIAWGNQIRSYVFQPYMLVKDHRTGVEVGNVPGVMNGDLDPFIGAFLRQLRRAAR
jgi:peptide chain release factor 2